MKKSAELAGRDAAILSAVEVGLGSVLHGLRVPFSGHFLSLNQSFILARSTLKAAECSDVRVMPAQISAIASVLKSLSPAGKKLTPMLAISAQGILFSLGTLAFGPRFAGILVGSMVASLWAFLQPVLIYYLLFGQTILHVADYFYQKTKSVIPMEQNHLLMVLGSIVGVKLLLSFAVTVTACKISDASVQKYEHRMLNAGRSRWRAMLSRTGNVSKGKAALLALRDLFNPLFVISLALTSFFFFLSHAPASEMIWALLRPLAVGFLLFYVIRASSFERVLTWLEKTRFTAFVSSFRRAVRSLKEF